MKTMIAMLMAFVLVVCAMATCSSMKVLAQEVPAPAAPTTPKHLGACPGGDWSYLWTGKKGEVPSGRSCPTGTKPGVLGTCDEIPGGRTAQDALDTRRAEAVSPASSWCTLARTTVCGQAGSDAAAVACIPDEAFVHKGDGKSPPPDLGTNETDVVKHVIDRAAATNVGVWDGCKKDADGTCVAAKVLEGGRGVKTSIITPTTVVRWENPVILDQDFEDLTSSGAGIPLALVLGFTAAGTAAGAGLGGAAWPDESSPDGFSTGGAGKGAAIGAGAGLVVGLLAWGIYEAIN